MKLIMIHRSFPKIKIRPNQKNSLVLNLTHGKRINLLILQAKRIEIKRSGSNQWRLIKRQSSRNKYIVSVEQQTSKIWYAVTYARNGIISIVLVLNRRRSLTMITNLTTVKNVLRLRKRTKARKLRQKKMMKRKPKTIESHPNRLMSIRNQITEKLLSKPLRTIKHSASKIRILIRKRVKIKTKKSRIQALKLLH